MATHSTKTHIQKKYTHREKINKDNEVNQNLIIIQYQYIFVVHQKNASSLPQSYDLGWEGGSDSIEAGPEFGSQHTHRNWTGWHVAKSLAWGDGGDRTIPKACWTTS